MHDICSGTFHEGQKRKFKVPLLASVAFLTLFVNGFVFVAILVSKKKLKEKKQNANLGTLIASTIFNITVFFITISHLVLSKYEKNYKFKKI